MQDEFVAKIQSRGYWRANFQPLQEQKLPIRRCKDLVSENLVSLRGWPYPYFPRRNDENSGLETMGTFYQGWVEFGYSKEFWRMYQSGQFLHYDALPEDWPEEDGLERPKPMVSLGVIGSVVYHLTEVYEFLARLTRAGTYEQGVRVILELRNTKGRQLRVDHSNRMRFRSAYQCGAEVLRFEQTLTKEAAELTSRELAFSTIIELFSHFGWDSPSEEQIRADQENLLERRFS